MKIPSRHRVYGYIFLFIILVGGGFTGGRAFEQQRLTGRIMLGQLVNPADLINRTKGQPNQVDFSLFWNVWNQVNDKFDGNLNDQQRLYGAIEGSLSPLEDPYTVFFDPDASKAFNNDLHGKLSGIGAEIVQHGEKMVVQDLLPDSPAYRAGIKPLDIIYKINDVIVDNNHFYENIQQIRGATGTSVKLTIIRPPNEKPLEVTIIREDINVASLSWSVRPDGVTVARLRQFSDDTPDLMQHMVDDMQKQNARSLVLDLRGDPGGFLDTARSIWGMLSADNPLVIEKTKRGSEQRLDGTGQPGFLRQIPLVVLVDNSSASASEIIAGAVQDFGRGTVIGQKTFGKGSVQDLIPLPGDASLKVTTAHWFTPKNRGINGSGITPDIQAVPPDNQPVGQDSVLDQAINLAKKKQS